LFALARDGAGAAALIALRGAMAVEPLDDIAYTLATGRSS